LLILQKSESGSIKVIGTTLNQRFTLDKELGRGGMGAVYRATDQVLQRTVAIKILKERTGDEVGRKIRLEAQILARLVHDNVVRLYDFGEADGTYYFVMEEVDGPSFSRRWKLIPLSERLRVISQVADALDYAHHQGVIHRDVKPANVLLTSLDSAKLSDFGLSLIADETQVSGTIKGTPHYMSPEQAKGRRLDHRTDLYALGVMIYECATGTPPFQGPTLAVIASHVNASPDSPRSRNPAISPALEAVILRLLEKNPENRLGSGAEVAAVLRDLIATDPALREPSAAVHSVDSLGQVMSTPPTMAKSSTPLNGQLQPSAGSTPGSGFDVKSGGTLASVGSTLPPLAPVPSASAGNDQAKDAKRADRARATGMVAEVVADPITLSADDRYFCGHYLAYLLGGSRRKGFFRRRPLDPLNADRARLMLAMTWLMTKGPADGAVEQAAGLLEARFDVRPLLSPIVVTKYLATRDTAGKRKAFRQARKRLQEASPYAQGQMTDDKGVLNPGLMPQKLDDLSKVSPAKVEVDDQLVSRWNRVVEVWRTRPDFRQAVLGYATTSAWRDPASADLWPEVVYPLIERARWQRLLRSTGEAAWDKFCDVLHLPDAGVRLDRAIRKVVPAQVVEKLDLSLGAFEEDPQLDADIVVVEQEVEVRRSADDRLNVNSMHELVTDYAPGKEFVRLTGPDPVRLTMGGIRDLWQEAVNALKTPGSKAGHRNVAIGPYRLAVIPSIRGKSAGQIAIQGMYNKQIEMLIPSIRLASNVAKPILAVWTYQDDSLAIAYIDYKNTERYISWHAPSNQQENFDDPGSLNSTLLQLGLEAPDQLDRALSKRFRPRNPV
jgi:eukaryotic-like serine/threonine-protein kinase